MGRSTASATSTVVTLGKRRVALAEHGDPEGRPLFLFHGTPASRLGHEFTHDAALERGIRIICPDRGGIGGSDPVPGRTIRSYAREVLDLADALDIDRFAVLGYSCGGPYALACAAGCGSRLRATALMAGVGPIDDRATAKDGLGTSDLRLVELSIHRPAKAARMLTLQRIGARLFPKVAVKQFAGALAQPDRDELARQDPKTIMAFFVEAQRQGPEGVIEDYRLWGSPWEIDWSAVTAPVYVFQGDADQLVPMHHAEDIVARLPAGIGHLKRLPGVGHVSIQTRIGQILDAVYPPGG